MNAEAPTMDLAELRRVAELVPDPEIPTVGLGDLGILRSVEADPTDPGAVVVTVTPTYSGCPAAEVIQADLVAALEGAGATRVEVHRVLNPPWSTDWITDAGRAKLLEAGIAPPLPTATGSVPVRFGRASRSGGFDGGGVSPPCPLCGSPDSELVSEFGSTACKAQYRCTSCAEPFDYFKATR